MNKFLLTILAALLSFSANAWTIGTAQGFKYTTPAVKFKIAGNNCTNAGFTTSSMETLAKDAIAVYWDKVPTSSLELESDGVQSGINVSADDLTTAAGKGSADNVVIGCSSNATLFPNGTTLAVGGIACNSGVCKGAVLLNDAATTQLDTLDRSTIITTFAHEFGHALGLGHSNSKTSLMYYAANDKTQKSLSQDDIDGITYLYPSEKELGGLAGACGSVDLNSKGGGPGNFLGALLIGLVFIFLARKFMSRSCQTSLL